MTVYVVQDQKWLDPNAQHQLRPKFDFEPAKEYGELFFLLRPTASPFDLPPVLNQLHSVLKDYTDNDFLLLVGNPVLMSLATAIAADYNDGNINLLQWSGAKGRYIPVYGVNIFFDKNLQ